MLRRVNPFLLEQAAKTVLAKQAFVPSELAVSGGGAPAPVAPAAGGAPPVDPAAMAGGAPPADPAAMAGGAPSGGMPPMDPAMMAAMAGGAPPADPAAGGMNPADLDAKIEQAVQKAVQAAQSANGGGSGGGNKPTKVDLNALSDNVWQIKKLLVHTLQQQGAGIPPEVLDTPSNNPDNQKAASLELLKQATDLLTLCRLQVPDSEDEPVTHYTVEVGTPVQRAAKVTTKVAGLAKLLAARNRHAG